MTLLSPLPPHYSWLPATPSLKHLYAATKTHNNAQQRQLSELTAGAAALRAGDAEAALAHYGRARAILDFVEASDPSDAAELARCRGALALREAAARAARGEHGAAAARCGEGLRALGAAGAATSGEGEQPPPPPPRPHADLETALLLRRAEALLSRHEPRVRMTMMGRGQQVGGPALLSCVCCSAALLWLCIPPPPLLTCPTLFPRASPRHHKTPPITRRRWPTSRPPRRRARRAPRRRRCARARPPRCAARRRAAAATRRSRRACSRGCRCRRRDDDEGRLWVGGFVVVVLAIACVYPASVVCCNREHQKGLDWKRLRGGPLQRKQRRAEVGISKGESSVACSLHGRCSESGGGEGG